MRAGSGELRIGMIGAGTMAAAHSIALANVAQLYPDLAMRPRLMAVADVNPTLATGLAERFGYERVETDWRSLVAAGDIDLVVVCLPPIFNREVVLAVAAAGKHVVCEKPLGASADIAAEMLEACQTAGVFHGLAAGYRWSPAVRAIAKLVRDGELGTIRSLRAAFMLDYAADPEVPLLWRFRQGSGRRRDRHRHGLPPRRLRAVHRRRDRDGPGDRHDLHRRPPAAGRRRGRQPRRHGAWQHGARIRTGRRRGRGRRPGHLRRRGLRRPRDQPRGDREAPVAPARGLRIAWLGRVGPRAAGRVPRVPARRPVRPSGSGGSS